MAIYSDLNSFNPTNNKPILTDFESVYQALFNLFNTNIGDRLFLPEYGVTLEDELFELMDDLSAFSVIKVVTDAIARWEGRVLIDNSQTKVEPDFDNNTYNLYLYFSIKGIDNQTFQMVGSFTQ